MKRFNSPRRKGLANQIKHHPMPSLLIGGGLAWLIADTSDDGDAAASGFSDRPGGERKTSALSAVAGSVGHAKDAVADAIGTAKEKVSDYSGTASEMGQRTLNRGRSTVRKLGHEVAHGFEVGTESFARAVQGYPLGVGLAFAALGALLGLALPHSRKEDELMGVKSEELLDTAKEKGGQLLETGMEIGGRVLDTLKDEAKEQGFTGRGLAETFGEITEKGTVVVEKAKAELVQAVQDSGGSKSQLAPQPV